MPGIAAIGLFARGSSSTKCGLDQLRAMDAGLGQALAQERGAAQPPRSDPHDVACLSRCAVHHAASVASASSGSVPSTTAASECSSSASAVADPSAKRAGLFERRASDSRQASTADGAQVHACSDARVDARVVPPPRAIEHHALDGDAALRELPFEVGTGLFGAREEHARARLQRELAASSRAPARPTTSAAMPGVLERARRAGPTAARARPRGCGGRAGAARRWRS
jgi:hypothetical protein